MIESFSIKNIATYDAEGIQIQSLDKINFIYGANGSGKTTISNFLTNPKTNNYLGCNIKWRNDQELQVLVYNKKFRENNFGKGTIEGVFTLGKATKEDIENVEAKQVELKKLIEEGQKKKETLEKQKEIKTHEENNFKEKCWQAVYKKHENHFKPVFSGSLQKETFKSKLLIELEKDKHPLLSIEDLKEKTRIIFDKKPETRPLINLITQQFDKLIEIESLVIWKKSIIGKSDVDIGGLIQKLSINDWVNQGREYLSDGEICPFCQQETITKEFRNKLESFFNESYTAAIKEIVKLENIYAEYSNNIIQNLQIIENSEKQNNSTKINIILFTEYLNTLNNCFIINYGLLAKKIKEPSVKIDLVSSHEKLQSIVELVTKANEEIKKHNNLVSNYQQEKSNLIKTVWKFVSEEYRTEIEAYNTKIKGLESGIKSLEEQQNQKLSACKVLKDEIIELSKKITSIEPTVNNINLTLKKFGFHNFEIVPSQKVKNHYQLHRENGDLAEWSLSEGEITFITFLYFMQLSKGGVTQESISDERVLVVDDPISSLDSTILFVVSALLKGVINNIKAEEGNIKQLITLTHNVYFHKEASFINGREKIKFTKYWILRRSDKSSTIQSYGAKNPINTSYQLLWNELKNKDRNSIVTIQNTMRRIIENYFKILGNYKDDQLIQEFTLLEEQEICRSLISWINDGSHSIADDLYIESQELSIDKYLKVFEAIFNKAGHEAHYKMMMEA